MFYQKKMYVLFSTGNLGARRPAKASSYGFVGFPTRANDGKRVPLYWNGSYVEYINITNIVKNTYIREQ